MILFSDVFAEVFEYLIVLVFPFALFYFHDRLLKNPIKGECPQEA